MKKLLIAILFINMAQAQTVLGGDVTTPSLDISVTKYSNGWSQWSSYPNLHDIPSCTSEVVTITTNYNFKTGEAFPLSDRNARYKYIGVNENVLETATTPPVYYHFVSNQDYDAFEDDLAYNPSDGSHLSPNGETWLDVCVSDLTPQAFLEAQGNYDEDRSRGSTYFFGDATNTYISIVSDSSFGVAIGTLPYIMFESYTTASDAYGRLQDLLALRFWERDLIGLGFTLESQSPNVWVKDCNGKVVVRHHPNPNRISIGGVPNTGIIDVGPGLTAIRNHCN